MQLSSNKWIVLGTMCLLTVMLNLDATAVNLAIPIISNQFHASLSNMQWVVNAFVLLSAMLQILGGRLGDLFEQRRIFNFGTLLFVVGSLVAGVAGGVTQLILGRVLQGIALGLAYPITIIITYAVFPKKQHGFAMGIMMGVMGLSLALGPTLGGLIIELANWRWIFFINVPVGVLAITMSLLFVPTSQPVSQHFSLDMRGILLLMLGLLGTIFALNQAQNWGFISFDFLIIFSAGIIFLIALYFVEKRAENPIVNFSIFKIRNYYLHILIRIVAQMVFIPILFFIPLYLMNIAEYTPLKTGFLVLVMTLTIGILSPFTGTWVDKIGDKLPSIISNIFFAAGCCCLTFLAIEPQLLLLTVSLILIGIGCGISFVSTTSGALRVIPEQFVGMATGVFFTVVWASCALAIAVCGTLLAIVSKNTLLNELASNNITLTSEQLKLLVKSARGLIPYADLGNQLPPQLLSQLKLLSQHAFMSGMHAIMWLFVFFRS